MFVIWCFNLSVKFFLDLDILNVLKPLIENYWFTSDLICEVFQLLSKIMAGTQQQIQVCLSCSLSLLTLCVCVCLCLYVCMCVYVCLCMFGWNVKTNSSDLFYFLVG